MSSPPVARTPRLPLLHLPPRPPRPSRALPLPLLLLRAAASASAALALGQTVLAGSFLNGHYDALRAHELGATALDTVLFVQLVAAALVCRGGGRSRVGGADGVGGADTGGGGRADGGAGAGARGPLRLFGTTALLLVAAWVQTAFGYERAVGLHVTLGVLLVSGLLFGLVDAWRLRLPGRTRGAAEVTADPGDGAGLLPRPTGHPATGSSAGSVEVAP
ncbi:hypothetical protein [Kitasatospora sp. NPDC093806]|uniref:hypothetical protein n=1 Tax=Kitasatospora sp. NPDC093806 TaxID=3155075 RepID=UPI00342F145B